MQKNEQQQKVTTDVHNAATKHMIYGAIVDVSASTELKPSSKRSV